MLGPGHAMSGAAIFLAGSAVYAVTTQQPVPPLVLTVGTVVFAGAALAPDLDSYSATVTRSFGVFGHLLYYITNLFSIIAYNLTKTGRDDPIENGHRTFTHTAVACVLLGLLVGFLTSLGGTIHLFNKTGTWGQLAAMIVIAVFTHLGVAGLFSKQIKKAKKAYGSYLLMLLAFMFAVIIWFITPASIGFGWLGWVVGFGAYVHILGDTITKKGTPMLWPLKIRGKRWYDVAPPLRITAGGEFELKILWPVFATVIILGIAANIYLSLSLASGH